MFSAILEAAQAYAAAGWPVFPVGRDKAPLTKHGFQDASRRPELLEEWWGHQYPESNVALAIPEGLLILDFDPRNGAPEPEVFNGLDTLRCETPSGGSHLYFTVPHGVEFAGKWMPGIDVKAGGKGYVLLPPSHNGERSYAWYKGEDPTGFWELEHMVKPLPNWVLVAITRQRTDIVLGGGLGLAEPSGKMFPFQLGTPYGEYGLQQQLGFLSMARNGERNERLNRVGFRIGQLVAAGELREDALYQVAQVAEWLGLDREEVGQTLRSAYEAGTRKPWKK